MSGRAVYRVKTFTRSKEGSCHRSSLSELTIAAYHCRVGARLIRKRASSAARSRAESRVLAMIIAAVGLPLFLAYVLVAADMRSDLSDLKPAQASLDQSMALVGWPGL